MTEPAAQPGDTGRLRETQCVTCGHDEAVHYGFTRIITCGDYLPPQRLLESVESRSEHDA